MANDYVRTRLAQIGVEFEQYQTGKNLNTSVGVRLILWQQAIVLWKEKPVIGVGIGNFVHYVKKNIAEKKTELRRSYGHAHNIFLYTLASTGFCGLVDLVAALFVLPAMFFWRSGRVGSMAGGDFIPLAG